MALTDQSVNPNSSFDGDESAKVSYATQVPHDFDFVLLCRALRAGVASCCLFAVPWVIVCSGSGKNKSAATAEPPEVVFDVPTIREVIAFEDFSGRTEASSAVEVRARVTGYLDRVYFKDGADVNEGDPLFEIDPRTYKAELDKAVADVGQIKRVARINGDYESCAMKLLKQNVITKEDADHTVFDRAEAEASLAAAEADRESAGLNLGFTKVAAPISGRISRRNVDPGNLARADDTLLTTIVARTRFTRTLMLTNAQCCGSAVLKPMPRSKPIPSRRNRSDWAGR